jgi:hypothetical protein
MRTTRRARAQAALAAIFACGFAAAGAPAGAPALPLIAAAGDVACPPTHPAYNDGLGTPTRCRQAATAQLLYHAGYDAILPIGDLVQPDATLANLRDAYGQTWGKLKGRTHPVAGNHEYDHHSHGSGYFDYFNGVGDDEGRAGARGRGWYSYDLGRWHMIALNANCDRVGCRNHSRQLVWLRRNLRRHRNRCVLAYWHQPLFSSGAHGFFKTPEDALADKHNPGYDENTVPFWRALHAAGADIVLNGHDHLYERFAPQTPSGSLDRKTGIVQFTVGTGGRSLFDFTHVARNSRKRISGAFGILRLRLGRGRYHWRFLDIDHRILDEGERRCTPIGPALRAHRHRAAKAPPSH